MQVCLPHFTLLALVFNFHFFFEMAVIKCQVKVDVCKCRVYFFCKIAEYWKEGMQGRDEKDILQALTRKKFLTFFGKPSSARLTNLDLCPSLFQAKIYIFIKKCFKEGKNLAFNYPSVPKNKTNFKFEEGVEVSPFNLTITYVSVVRYVFI